MGLFDGVKKMLGGFSMGGNRRFYQDKLGLDPDEDFKAMAMGALWRDPTASENAEAAGLAAVALFTGHFVVQTGVQAAFGITTKGRLVIGMIQGADEEERMSFDGEKYRLEDTGRTSPKKVMGMTGKLEDGKILSLTCPSGELFQLIVSASVAGEFANWP